MYLSRALTVLGLRFASVSSQAVVWKIGSGGVVSDGFGRWARMFCTSVSSIPGSASSTAWDAVFTLIRPGSSGLRDVVTLSSKMGNCCLRVAGSFSGQGTFTLGAWGVGPGMSTEVLINSKRDEMVRGF